MNDPGGMAKTPRAMLGVIVGGFFAVLAGCGDPVKEPERPSDPTDYFYRPKQVEGVSHPLIRWHERQPGRLFETTLRPTEMRGAFSTAYLSRITRNDQSYSKRIWDVVYGAFDLSDVSPLPPERGIGWGTQEEIRQNEVRFEIGGWERSGTLPPEVLAKIHNAQIQRRGDSHTVVASRSDTHYFSDPEASDLDGQTVAVECWKIVGCRTELTIPQETAGLPSLSDGAEPGRTTGAGLVIIFHSDLIDDWPEIRRKAVCFAAISIPNLDTGKIAPIGRLHCGDVRRAIKRTIRP